METKKFFLRVNNLFRSALIFPSWQDCALAVLSAILLIFAFPDFELWFLAWFAFVPLFIAIKRNKFSSVKGFWLGWLAGTIFFYGTCWWLTFAPINYGGIPSLLTYVLLIPACLGAGIFIGAFSAILSCFLNKFGSLAIFLAPFVWAAAEYLRLLITGNAWNALGYSQAFVPSLIHTAEFGGVFGVSFLIVAVSSTIFYLFFNKDEKRIALSFLAFIAVSFCIIGARILNSLTIERCLKECVQVIALQPNVPMNNLKFEDYQALRRKHVEMAESALREIEKTSANQEPRIVVFPESPMNFEYAHDSEFREFLQDFTARNRVSLIFNAAEPTLNENGYHNSAVMVNARGEKIVQYDKIRLVPFGEFVPEWLPGNQFLPTVVGHTKPGKDFRLMPLGSTVRAGTMICYESAFGDLSRGFVQNGADVLIELTNDGYGGPTPILRQHLANAVFRAVETDRPVLRVTNVGISAYINQSGQISDATESYTTATRVWRIEGTSQKETFYVRYGDLFAQACTITSFIFLILSFYPHNKTQRV